MCNILILSAGRRVELVQRFREAATKRGKSELVVAVDSEPLAPALYAADHWSLIERVAAPNYIANLISIINDFNIKLVVPTIDTELSTLAIHRHRIERSTNARVLVASEDTINTCADKVLTSEFIQKIGLSVPTLIPEPSKLPETSFPVFVKPRQGSSSIGAATVHDRQQLLSALRKTVDPMVQELATGLEYTVDCFSDFDGRPLSIVPRQRLATRAGEISKGRVVRAPTIEREARHLLNSLSIPGPSTIQCFWDEHDVQFIEVNARFGGGAPMSIAAGSNSIEKLFRLLDGEELPFDSEFAEDLIFLRYDQAICINAAGQQVNT